MTRFNITLKESVQLVVRVINGMVGGEIFVPKIPSFKVIDFAKAISTKARIKFVGINLVKNYTETCFIVGQNTIAYKLLRNNFKFRIILLEQRKLLKKFGKKCSDGFSYDSGNNKDKLDIKILKKIIEKEAKELNLK